MKKIISAVLVVLLTLSTVAFAKTKEYSLNGQYSVGDIVSNNGDLYICVEHNKTNQCSFGEDYEPGVGDLWEETWELYEENTDDEDDDDTDNDNSDIDETVAPAIPKITTQTKAPRSSSFTLDWEIAKSENPGTIVKVYENNKLVKTLTAKSDEYFQEGKISISGKLSGKYTYYMYLCNKSGLKEKCSKSNSVTITVDSKLNNDNEDDEEDEDKDTKDDEDEDDTGSLDRSKVPTFSELPKNRTFSDYSKTLEASLKKEIKDKKLSRADIQDKIDIIDKWLNFLYALNKKGDLVGKEKRSIFILQMTKKVLEKYN